MKVPNTTEMVLYNDKSSNAPTTNNTTIEKKRSILKKHAIIHDTHHNNSRSELEIQQDRLDELKNRLETRFMKIEFINGRCESYCPLEIILKETYGIIFINGRGLFSIHFHYEKINDNMITVEFCQGDKPHSGKGQRIGLLELYQIIKCLI